MNLRNTSGTLAVAALLLSPGVAQSVEYFGHWDDFQANGSSIVTREIYVSPTGDNTTGDGSALAPWKTIGFALSQLTLESGTVATARRLAVPHTLNLAPGAYDLAADEDLAASSTERYIRMPAHGLTIETWPGAPITTVSEQGRRARLYNPGEVAIAIDVVGNQTIPGTGVAMPGSVIQNVEVESSLGVGIDPASGEIAPPAEPVHVEVRDCFLDCNVGVSINTIEGWRAFHVIERNVIEGDHGTISFVTGLHQGAAAAFGIFETVEEGAVSSTLVRANDIYWFELGVWVGAAAGGAQADWTRPRLQSNFVSFCNTLVRLERCDADVVNNTIAFSTKAPTSVPNIGVEWVAQCADQATLNLYNNILWNPDHLSPVDFAPINPTDLVLPSGCGASTAFTINSDRNLIYDVDFPNKTPVFAGGDGHPNEFVTQDLHLTQGSADARDVGDTSRTIQSGIPNPPWFAAVPPASTTDFVRLDLGVDVDTDPRALPAPFSPTVAVDIGADEYSEVRIGLTVPSWATPAAEILQDAYGNLRPDPADGYEATVFVDAPQQPGAAFSLFLGTGFVESFGLVPNSAIYQNLMVAGVGNLLLDPSGTLSMITVVAGTLDGAGHAAVDLVEVGRSQVPAGAIPILYFVPGAPGLIEGENVFQLLLADGTGTGQLSNEVRIEFEAR